jgi:hypothetical protein
MGVMGNTLGGKDGGIRERSEYTETGTGAS